MEIDRPRPAPLATVPATAVPAQVQIGPVLARMAFAFQLKSLDTSRSITFIDPLIERHSERYSSGVDSFSRPFAQQRQAQSIEAPSKSYSFSDLFLDARYRYGATEESGGGRPDLRGIIMKITDMMEIHPLRLRKERLMVRFGSTVIGAPNRSYCYLSSLSVDGENYGNSGNLMSCRLSMEVEEFGWQ